LPYLPAPSEFLASIIGKRFPMILVDRTYIFRSQEPTRLTIQRVDPRLYEGRYPAWIFNRRGFLDIMLGDYELLAEFEPYWGPMFDEIGASCLGFIFTLREPRAGEPT
jgi:putative methyltransferase (TIGR04325 family)